jgi:hypothetical protein
MNELTTATIRTGIIPEEVQSELKRWTPLAPPLPPPKDDLVEALEDVVEAFEGRDAVTFRCTDPDAVRLYDESKQPGRIYYLAAPKRPGDKPRTTFVEIEYGRDALGNYLVPWVSEDITGMMIHRDTYLKPVGGEHVHFGQVVELFYGEKKMFMLCYPAEDDA